MAGSCQRTKGTRLKPDFRFLSLGDNVVLIVFNVDAVDP